MGQEQGKEAKADSPTTPESTAEAASKAANAANPKAPAAAAAAQPAPSPTAKVDSSPPPAAQPASQPAAAASSAPSAAPSAAPAAPEATAAASPELIAKADGKSKQPKAKAKGKAKSNDKGLRLCIKNLGEDMTQEQLRTLFEAYGPLKNVNVKTNEEGKCRGFAFVNLTSAELVSKAIAEMDKKDIGGKQISVAPAEDREKQGGAQGEKAGGKGKGKGQDGKGDSKGKGRGKGKKGGGEPMVQAQPAGFIPPQGAAGYPNYPYNYQQYQQLYQVHQAAQAAQMQAHMQAMMSSMYLQALQGQAQSQQFSQARPLSVSELIKDPKSAKEYIGTLKSLSDKKGYGFIECEEIKQLFPGEKKKDGTRVGGRDAYVSADILPEGGKELGVKLKFTVGVNSKGHPQVQSCSLMSEL